jgi:glutamate N-acetyltransferase/amino-acid N-acetyltransferase
VSVTAPLGFTASGIAAGLKVSGRPDLGLVVSDTMAAAAGVFTTNAFPAAPVTVTMDHLVSGRARAVVVNSGQANAGTGEQGLADAERMCAMAAEAVGAAPADVLVCSTGVIGPRVKMAEAAPGIRRAAATLGEDGGSAFARAILTTDTDVKEVVVRGEGFTVGGCAKGAGMIAPDLATLLAFLTTDAEVEPSLLDALVRRVVAPAFNGITVDGCTSTNDTVLVMAGGAGGAVAAPGTRALAGLESALTEAARDLARQVVLDAEGATKAIAVQVTGAQDAASAARVADAVAGSLLVKTAVFGADPNAGRILQAVGAAGVPLVPHLVSARLAGHEVVRAGALAPFDAEACREALKERDVVIRVDLGLGRAEATAFGCDLGYEYVRINAEYTT